MKARTVVATLRSAGLAGCALWFATSASLPADGQKAGAPSQKAISKELKQLYDDDQKDQNDPSWTESNDAEFSRRQKERRDRVLQIVEAGMLADMQDWDHAALLLQHGQTPEDILLAHVLSIPPGTSGLPNAPFMCAATLDRYLQGVGRAQIFTTQSGAADPKVYLPMEPFDDTMDQSVRSVFGLPPLARQKDAPKRADKKSAGPSAKELPKLLKQSKEAPAAGAEAAEWLVRTREIVLGGTLESEKDFDLAANVLLASKEPEDLLSAHVLAMCAAIRSKKGGAALILCARTLDRFLLSIGKPQCFDTVLEKDVAQEPRRPVPEFIRAEYGTSAGRKAK